MEPTTTRGGLPDQLTGLGDRVRLHRGKRPLRLVAAETGVSAPTLSRIEHGATPDARTLLALLAWLGEQPALPPATAIRVVLSQIARLRRRRRFRYRIEAKPTTRRGNYEV